MLPSRFSKTPRAPPGWPRVSPNGRRFRGALGPLVGPHHNRL